ncbi:hypothetical protein ACQ4LE_008567, partial [Meloidogyne hapla]
MKILIFYLLILLSIKQCLNVQKVCKCPGESIEKIYCRSDWVALTLRTDYLYLYKLNNEVQFEVQFLYVFKDNKNKTDLIYTPWIDNLCGIYLHYNTQYLVFGNYKENNKRFTTLCEFNQEWHKI